MVWTIQKKSSYENIKPPISKSFLLYFDDYFSWNQRKNVVADWLNVRHGVKHIPFFNPSIASEGNRDHCSFLACHVLDTHFYNFMYFVCQCVDIVVMESAKKDLS